MPMFDGFKTTIGFTLGGGLVFPEVSVKPFGLDGRGPIDTTSMRNTRFVTKWPKQLTDLTPVEADCQWDPADYPRLKRFILLVNQLITIFMPSGAPALGGPVDALQFYGWLDKAEPQPQKEGEVPIIKFTIIPSNIDEFGVEVAPRLTGVPFP